MKTTLRLDDDTSRHVHRDIDIDIVGYFPSMGNLYCNPSLSLPLFPTARSLTGILVRASLREKQARRSVHTRVSQTLTTSVSARDK